MTRSESNEPFEESYLLIASSYAFGLRCISIRGRKWLGYSYSITLVVLYHALFFCMRKSMFDYYEEFENRVFYLRGQRYWSYANLLVVAFIVSTSSLGSSSMKNFYKKLRDVDRILAYLKVAPNREAQMRRETVNLGGAIIFTILTNLTSYFILITPGSGPIYNLAWIFNHVPIFLEIILLCTFVITVRKIFTRFNNLNHVIPNLTRPLKIRLVLSTTFVDNASKLKLARRAHLFLHEATDLVNEDFGSRLLFIFALTFVRVVFHLYEAYKLVGIEAAWLDLGLHLASATFHFSTYIYLAETCHATVAQARVAAGIFFETSISPGYGGSNDEVVAFSRQLSNKKLRFTVRNFLAIDYPTVLTIFLAALTYLFIMVRMA